MVRAADLMEIPELPRELEEAALNGEFVLFVGAGVSRLVGLPSWSGLALDALKDLQKEGLLNFSELEQLKNLDPKKQLSIAELIAWENSLPFDLRKHLTRAPGGEEGIYLYLNNFGCACVTTNYDELLSPRFVPPGDGSTPHTKGQRFSRTDEFYADHLNTPGTVVHLHGAVSQPSSMVVTTKEYLEHYDSDQVQHFLGELFEKKVVLFIGYGLEEAEVLEHILRRGKVRGDSKIKRRFALQGFFKSEEPLYKKLHEYYSKSFGVHLIGFVRDYKDYNQLETIVKTWSELIEVRPPALAEDLAFMDEVLSNACFNAGGKDLLYRIEIKPALQPHFFRKAKGLHWFDPLCEKGFFAPEKNPKPVPAEEGFVNIPTWHAVEHLVATSSEVGVPGNEDYAVKFLKVIREVTDYARTNKYGNWRTWWQFAKIISRLPSALINEGDLELVGYWLDDPYEQGFVAEELGENWLPKLLDGDEYCSSLALRLLDKLFSVHFVEEKFETYSRWRTQIRFKSWHVKKIIEKVGRLGGQKLGIEAVKIFESKLVTIFEKSKNDSFSSIWRRAIEEHVQNRFANKAEDILIAAYLELLLGAIELDPESSSEYLKHLLDSQYQTLRRLAIHAIGQKFDRLNDLTKYIIVRENFSDNLRHEVWHFLKRNYSKFRDDYKKEVLKIIETLEIHNDDGGIEEGPTAYRRSIWLSAIKDIDEQAFSLYQRYVGITGTEPEHPDFSSYVSAGWVSPESPIPFDHLLSLEITQLIETVNDYMAPGTFKELRFEGIAKVFRNVVKSRASEFSLELDRFLNLDPVYITEVLEAFHELWNEKRSLDWKDIWPHLLEYCEKLISDEKFWLKEKPKQMENFLANRDATVRSVARLIEDGTKSDDHAFEPDLLPKAKGILLILLMLLEKQEGEEFSLDRDAVTVAINSARGCCIEAMINCTLRACRLMDKDQEGHLDVWREYEPIYDAELKGNELGKYEFATLVAYYLPNFLYMSKEWVSANLGKIFDQSDYQKWFCAIQGYSHVSSVYQEIYKHLKRKGDFVKALDDENFEESVQEVIIHNIVVSYIHDYESLTDRDSLISVLLERKDYEELRHLIWFVWTLRQRNQPSLSVKVFELWPKLLRIIDFETKTGRKLASSLCHWAAFIDEISDFNRDWLLKIAPYAEEENNSYDLLENLARISRGQPLEAQGIWLKMLANNSPDYPDESIKQFLANLTALGPEGERKAKEVVDAYIRHGNEQPRKWLMEIKEQG